MRCSADKALAVTGLVLWTVFAVTGCARMPQEGVAAATKTSAAERSLRRAFDGAPPVVPHADFGRSCGECHGVEARSVEGVGLSPPSPHEITLGMSSVSNCAQCHVRQRSREVFRSNKFAGLVQDLRPGRRHAVGAPPVMPHPIFLRENCLACHGGEAAREEIRTSHPERARCGQCHVQQLVEEDYSNAR